MGKMKKSEGLIYSTGPVRPAVPEESPEPVRNPAGAKEAVLRMEKKGRGGKTVTVIEMRRFPGDEILDWASLLKSKCGTGGTVKGDMIEIQGEKRDIIRSLFQKQGINVKG